MVKVSFTRHADDMLRERKFTKEDIISIIGSYDWRGREEPYTVITMFYDKRLRNRK